MRNRILATVLVTSLNMVSWAANDSVNLNSPSASAPRVKSSSYRTAYVGYQTLLTTYTMGVALPLAFGADEPRVLIATPLIVAPLAFGAHLWMSNKLELSESHFKGTLYAPLFSVYGATAIPLALSDSWQNGYQLGSILGVLAYPLGLWYGFHLGDVYHDNPNQIDAKFRFATGYAFLGLITPALYFDHPDNRKEDILRLGLGQSVGMALLGHLVADYYRTGSEVPSGVNMGIGTHAVLGGLAGVQVAAMTDAKSVQPWIGSVVLGTTLGFTEGVFFFYTSHDSHERSLYSLLGGVAGTAMGAGFQLLFYDSELNDYDRKITLSSYLIGGAWMGYWATYLLTQGLTEATRSGSATITPPSAWAFNLIPEMEWVRSRDQIKARWCIRGVTYRF